MADLFLLQMAGVPGSGKSALARLIGRATDAVVLDKDVLKTAALEAGIEEPAAGSVAYESFFALANHLLGQDRSVVLDSPSFWETIHREAQPSPQTATCRTTSSSACATIATSSRAGCASGPGWRATLARSRWTQVRRPSRPPGPTCGSTPPSPSIAAWRWRWSTWDTGAREETPNSQAKR